MPLSGSYEKQSSVLNAVRHFRRKPVLGYSLAIGSVACAVVVRSSFGQWLEIAPFVTFYPAIVATTLLAGFGPGVFAIVLSTASALFLFLPPVYSFSLEQQDSVALLLFLFVNAFNVAMAGLLNTALEHVLTQREHISALIEGAPNGIIVVDDKGDITLANAASERIFGYGRNEIAGRRVETLIPENLRMQHERHRQNFMREPHPRMMGTGFDDLHAKRRDGADVPVEIGLSPVSGSGKTGVLATVIDISERKKAQEWQKLLVGELQHRSQNLLQVILSIVTLSLVSGPKDEKQKLLARIRALATAHRMIADAALEGAPLRDIVRREFELFSDRLTLEGCDIVLSPAAAQNFALIVHELATNAAKHGALSVEGGWVEVRGVADGGALRFQWTERGGPMILGPSARKGFGSKILIDVAKGFAERAEMNYGPEGVVYTLSAQLAAVTSSAPNSKHAVAS